MIMMLIPKRGRKSSVMIRNQEKLALSQALELIESKLGQLKKELLEKGGY